MSGSVRRAHATGVAFLVVALLGLLMSILLPSAATASSSAGHVLVDLGHGDGFTASPHGALLDMTRLAPGLATSARMGVRNAFDGPSDLYLRFTNVSERDNDCTHAEQVVDHDCGHGAGQIGAELIFSVAIADTDAGAYSPAWSGSGAQLAQGVAVTKAIPASSAKWVRLTASLPASAGNEAETDTYNFSIQVVLQGSAGVDSVHIGRPSGGSGVLALAVTGISIALLCAGAALLIICGVLLLLGARIDTPDAEHT